MPLKELHPRTEFFYLMICHFEHSSSPEGIPHGFFVFRVVGCQGRIHDTKSPRHQGKDGVKLRVEIMVFMMRIMISYTLNNFFPESFSKGCNFDLNE